MTTSRSSSSASRAAWVRVGLLADKAYEASRVAAALVTERPSDLGSDEFNAALAESLAAADVAHVEWKRAFDEYEAIEAPQPVPEPPKADAGLVQHVVSLLPDGHLELEQSTALSFEHDDFISFGLISGFELLTRRSDARGLYIRDNFKGARLLELIPDHQFSLFEYMALRPLQWRDGQLRAAREYTRRKIKSLALSASAQHA